MSQLWTLQNTSAVMLCYSLQGLNYCKTKNVVHRRVKAEKFLFFLWILLIHWQVCLYDTEQDGHLQLDITCI